MLRLVVSESFLQSLDSVILLVMGFLLDLDQVEKVGYLAVVGGGVTLINQEFGFKLPYLGS